MAVIRKTVILREQELMISIGLHAHEKVARQRLLVSVEIELSSLDDEGDDIRGTFDYDKIHSFIKALGEGDHLLLQETVARRVLEFLLQQDGVIGAVVETRKPDIFDDCAYVGARLEGRAD